MKKCEYMAKRIGEVFEGVISGVTNWGFYVELPNTVEGLVHVNELQGDYYVFNEEAMELRGETSGKVYKLGQKIAVAVAGTDKLTRTVDFIPAEYGGLTEAAEQGFRVQTGTNGSLAGTNTGKGEVSDCERQF